MTAPNPLNRIHACDYVGKEPSWAEWAAAEAYLIDQRSRRNLTEVELGWLKRAAARVDAPEPQPAASTPAASASPAPAALVAEPTIAQAAPQPTPEPAPAPVPATQAAPTPSPAVTTPTPAPKSAAPEPQAPARPAPPPPAPRILDEVHAVARRWFGDGYDMATLDATLATAAAERLNGDPLWLLVIAGSGNTKTETVQSLVGTGAVVCSTISGEAALLSGTPKKEREKDATGGLLRTIGERGILVLKDFTSVISMHRDRRAEVLAAFREIHDGRWSRSVGAGGGRPLEWRGRIVLIGACTTAWDEAHAAVSACGDRFVLIRSEATDDKRRRAVGRQALRNTGSEVTMRDELSAAVGGLLGTIDVTKAVEATDAEEQRLLDAAAVVTRCRTAVIVDFKGDVTDAHTLEAPTRFGKQLLQLFRGAVAIGLSRADALRLALRAARDSMPPMRLAVLRDVAAFPESNCHNVSKRIDKPWATVKRAMDALHALGALAYTTETVPAENGDGKGEKTVWRYRVAVDVAALDPEPTPTPASTPSPDRKTTPVMSPPVCKVLNRGDQGPELHTHTRTLPGLSDGQAAGAGGNGPATEPSNPYLTESMHDGPEVAS